MLVTLIPLFLAANISVNEGEWKYGPEVIYDAKFDGITPELSSAGKYVMFNTTLKLKCRPKREMVLSCRFSDPKVVLTLLTTVGDSRVVHHSKEYRNSNDTEEVFEIDLAPGHNSLIVNGDINYFKLDVARALVDQLWFNVGANLTETSAGRFKILTNSSAGSECPTRYFVNTYKIGEDDVKLSKNERSNVRDVVILPSTTLRDEAMMRITIFRDLRSDSCSTIWESGRLVARHFEGSKSCVIVTANNFTSYSEYKVAFEDSNYRWSVERVALTLDDIVPAKGPMPSVRDPRDFGQQSTKAFHSDSFEYVFEKNLDQYILAMVGDVA